MEHVMLKKNILLENTLLKYGRNYKSTDSLLHLSNQPKRVMKSCDKNKDTCELSVIDDEILKKEFQDCLHLPTEELPNLTIQNDVDFKLNAKEKISKPTTNSNLLKTTNINIDATNISETKKTINNEIIEIKCTQKISDSHDTINGLENKGEILVKDQNELNYELLDEKKKISTIDLKSDLQSLLIMMALSSAPSDKSNYQLKNIETSPISEVYMKNMNAKVENSDRNNVCNEISDLLKIEALKFYDDSVILRKYANKWIEYVKGRRENISQRQRLTNINNFLDRLEKKKNSMKEKAGPANKAKLQAHDYNTYQHRYKVQKHIIALQKAKLEHQNRLIEQLKYNKIIDASRQSLDCMKDDVRQTYYKIDKHLKPKIKCLTNELKIRDIEDTSLVLHCLKVPQFLQRMEARAREREEKHAMIRERRKQMEEERIRLKQQAELAKVEMDKEEKEKRMKELREKRRKEKTENIRKKQHAERLRALIVMADLHYEKYLTAKYGIRPLKLLIQIKRDNLEKAKALHQFHMKKNVFLNWMWYTEDMWYERNFKAEDFHKKKLMKQAFNCFKKNHKEYLLKMQVAKDYYDLYVTQLVFKKFQEGLLVIKKELNIKWTTANIYYNSNLLFKTLTCWRTLPGLNALKREQDARKIRWRAKVLQVVPDYVPPED